MDERMKRLLGDGPYPFPIDEIDEESVVEAFVGPGMIVLPSKGSIYIPKGSHAHTSYEFLIPLSEMPYTAVEKKSTHFEKDRLFPLNSDQAHGTTTEIMGCNLFGFLIGRDAFNEISQSLCRKKDVVFQNESIKISPEIYALLNMFMEETRNLQTGSDFILQNIINLITINLLRQLKSDIPKLITEKNYCERDNINRAISYLRETYDKTFSLDDVSRIANLSPYHFIRTFKLMTGKTPYDYLLGVKIEKAKELLKYKNNTITDICFICGFNNLEHFASVFKRKVGILPSQYRKM